MLKTIFGKTLYEKRWGMLWWSLAMFATTLLIVLMFPIFQDSFGKSLQDVPESLRSILGDASDYQRLEGFLELQVFLQMIFLTIIYGIILFTGLLAGEENDGTLQTLLSQPVSRTKVYFHKLLAANLILWVVSFAMFLAVWLGAVLINESVDVWRLLQGTFALWLVSAVLSIFGYMLGAVTGRRGLAGALAGIFAFASYLVSSLVATVDALKPVNYVSPFKYFNNPRVMEQGLQMENVMYLVIGCVVPIIIGWIVFMKRDVFQR